MNFLKLGIVIHLLSITPLFADGVDQQIQLGVRAIGQELIGHFDRIALANPEFQCTELVSAARRSYMAARPSNLDRIITDSQVDALVRRREGYNAEQYRRVEELKTGFFAKVTQFRAAGALEQNLSRVSGRQQNALQRSCANALSSYLLVKPVLASSIRNFVNFRSDRVKRVVYRAKTNILQSGMTSSIDTLKDIALRGYPTATGVRASCGFTSDLLTALDRDESFIINDINQDVLGWYGLSQVRQLDADIRDIERSVRFDGQLLLGVDIAVTAMTLVTPVGLLGGAARATLSIPVWMASAGRVATVAATIGSVGYAGYIVHNSVSESSRAARSQIQTLTASSVESQNEVLRSWATLPVREHVHEHVNEPMDFYIQAIGELKRETEALYSTVGRVSGELFDLLTWAIQEPNGQNTGLSLCHNHVPSRILTQYLRLYLANSNEIPTGEPRRSICQAAMDAKLTFQRHFSGRAAQRWGQVYALPSQSHTIQPYEYQLSEAEFDLLATAQGGMYEYSEYVSYCAPDRLNN